MPCKYPPAHHTGLKVTVVFVRVEICHAPVASGNCEMYNKRLSEVSPILRWKGLRRGLVTTEVSIQTFHTSHERMDTSISTLSLSQALSPPHQVHPHVTETANELLFLLDFL